ncbi:pyridoxamine 5'-phosphate oxidase family protein [Aliikangiella coralliicola]|uniref:2Fe-2S iron-sulfur cluster binding domain-containing protein n=1 Tax=Aliikangiella coralliicola TaxID=2592383 RepID=A0A545UFB7_9GAMM|nr:pyridoxamine 5'-phosphate oxidase family protein [Aliikangiella coralliicola]TQV88171.1 2Fe-2S iron-sulfur cluster binding domain-containing protein [Aliikangiella coralliicola]
MNNPTPFHSGELKVQQRAKEASIAQRNGTAISHLIIPGAIPFIAQQNMLVVTSVDHRKKVWVSILIGDAGFVSAPDPESIVIDTTKLLTQQSDIFWRNIKVNAQIGLLAIELSTRRRLRVNGTISQLNQTRFKINVEQAFPNCPKYIQRRSLDISSPKSSADLPPVLTGHYLTNKHIELIQNADSFFVGSANTSFSNSDNKKVERSQNQIELLSCDASHRGGFPGFVEVIDGKTLRIPDYRGNSMFNTLGNIENFPFASIVFIDFENLKILQLSGRAKILWDQHDPTDKTAGTRRFWTLAVDDWQETTLPDAVNWKLLDYSPHNPRETKNTQQTIRRLELKVEKIEQKSKRVKLFRLVSQKGELLPAFEPGAHLPIEINLSTGEKVKRHYSLLSSSHDNRFYEIAVQLEAQGRGGSMFIHQQITVGSTITSGQPQNNFPLSPISGHTILIAGGIGITPILSMLRKLSEEKRSFEIHYAARNPSEFIFFKTINSLAGDKASFYHSSGPSPKRLPLQKIMESAPGHSHLFICGPARMINSARTLTEGLNWSHSRLHFESFGATNSADDKAIDVTLKKSARVIKVKPTETILDALIKSNVPIPFDCKRGECGMCATKIISGQPEHRDIYLNQDERAQQICVCVSRAKGSQLTLDL